MPTGWRNSAWFLAEKDRDYWRTENYFCDRINQEISEEECLRRTCEYCIALTKGKDQK